MMCHVKYFFLPGQFQVWQMLRFVLADELEPNLIASVGRPQRDTEAVLSGHCQATKFFSASVLHLTILPSTRLPSCSIVARNGLRK